MSRLEKETLEGFQWIEAEIHNIRETNDPKQLKNIKTRLGRLQDLLNKVEEDIEEKAATKQ